MNTAESAWSDVRTWLAARVAGVARLPATLLFPPLCAGCRRQIVQTGAVCARCWPQLRFLEQPWCPVMGTPFAQEMGPGFLSAEAIANPPDFDRARAAVGYSGLARQMVQSLKYRDGTNLAPWMAGWMLRAGAELTADADFVLPVPLHRRRFLERRYNQSAELARAVARQAGIVFAPDIAERVKLTRQQVGLARREREENVRAAFAVPQRHRARIAGRRVLVVDDVLTTGATVGALAKALKKAGASGVDVLTFARVIAGDFREAEPWPI